MCIKAFKRRAGMSYRYKQFQFISTVMLLETVIPQE